MQFGSLAILARLIEPNDFGLFAMALVFIRFAGLLGNMGLIQAIIQRRRLKKRELNSLFWFSAVVNSMLGALLYLGAPAVVAFYGEERLYDLIKLLSLSAIFQNLGNVSRAFMERRYSFSAVMTIEIVSMALGIASAVLMALRGFGIYALVAQDLVHLGTKNLFLLLVSPWKPTGRFAFGDISSFCAYAGGLTGSNLVHFLSRNLDNVMIGKNFGATQLGFYQKAYSLLMLPLRQLNIPLSRALLPALSRKREFPDDFRRAYRHSYSCLSALAIPMVALIGVTSRELILLLLGPNWLDAHTFFMALLPGAFASATNMGTGWVFTSWGHTHRQFQWSLIQAGVLVIGIWLSSRVSPIAVAWTFSLSFALLRIPAVLFCFQPTPLRAGDFWFPTLRHLTACLCAAALVIWTMTLVGTAGAPPLATAIGKGSLFVAYTLGLDFLLPGVSMRKRYLLIAHHLFSHD